MARPGAFLTGFLPDHPAFGFDMTISNLTKQGEEGLFIASMRQTFLERSEGGYLSFSPPRGVVSEVYCKYFRRFDSVFYVV
jgi:hypothetical protein